MRLHSPALVMGIVGCGCVPAGMGYWLALVMSGYGMACAVGVRVSVSVVMRVSILCFIGVPFGNEVESF